MKMWRLVSAEGFANVLKAASFRFYCFAPPPLRSGGFMLFYSAWASRR